MDRKAGQFHPLHLRHLYFRALASLFCALLKKVFFANFRREQYLILQPNEQWGRLVATPGEGASVPPDRLAGAHAHDELSQGGFRQHCFVVFFLRFAEIVLSDI